MPDNSGNNLLAEYDNLFNTCLINGDKYADIDSVINRMMANKSSYDSVAGSLKIPWYFIAIIHCMEGSLSFKKHLHNGDPLTARTVQVPKGRPVSGKPPFTWEESAVDALTLEGFTAVTDWSIAGMLHSMEKYNGMGYRKKGINSPYLWSLSNHYTAGKFTADGVFDPHAVSKQMGAAVILRRMREKQLALEGEADTLSMIKNIADQVFYNPSTPQEKAKDLQILLNTIGMHVRVDGVAGQMTSDAYRTVSGKYLRGDNR